MGVYFPFEGKYEYMYATRVIQKLCSQDFDFFLTPYLPLHLYVQQDLEIRGFWFQKKTQNRTLWGLYLCTKRDCFSKNSVSARFGAKIHLCQGYCGAFNLHRLEFTFTSKFYSRKTILVESIFWNPAGLFAFMSFHIYFKLFWYCVLLNMRGFFCPYLFWDTVKWYLNW